MGTTYGKRWSSAPTVSWVAAGISIGIATCIGGPADTSGKAPERMSFRMNAGALSERSKRVIDLVLPPDEMLAVKLALCRATMDSEFRSVVISNELVCFRDTPYSGEVLRFLSEEFDNPKRTSEDRCDVLLCIFTFAPRGDGTKLVLQRAASTKGDDEYSVMLRDISATLQQYLRDGDANVLKKYNIYMPPSQPLGEKRK